MAHRSKSACECKFPLPPPNHPTPLWSLYRPLLPWQQVSHNYNKTGRRRFSHPKHCARHQETAFLRKVTGTQRYVMKRNCTLQVTRRSELLMMQWANNKTHHSGFAYYANQTFVLIGVHWPKPNWHTKQFMRHKGWVHTAYEAKINLHCIVA